MIVAGFILRRSKTRAYTKFFLLIFLRSLIFIMMIRPCAKLQKYGFKTFINAHQFRLSVKYYLLVFKLFQNKQKMHEVLHEILRLLVSKSLATISIKISHRHFLSAQYSLVINTASLPPKICNCFR
jgi:hypothetical protein